MYYFVVASSDRDAQLNIKLLNQSFSLKEWDVEAHLVEFRPE